MIAVAGWQHIVLGFFILITAPLLSRQRIQSYGRVLIVLSVWAALGQIFIGLSKLGENKIHISTVQGNWILGLAAALCVFASWWILRRSRRNL